MRTETACLEWVERLIAIDTTSELSNMPLIRLVADDLAGQGVKAHVRPNRTGEKANLIATIPAADGSVTGGIVFSGHTDVVPVAGQAWSSDPFAATVRDGNLYGRGTCDMKGFIGVVLGLVPRMLELKLREPIHLALSYDEEVGLHGGAQLVEDFRALGLAPRACVVGEPTGMEVIGSHKGIGIVDIFVTGQAAHSSLAPNTINAVTYAARLVTFCDDLAEEFRELGPFDENYNVPFSTVSVNQMAGGGLGNTVPATCHVRLDFRTLAAADPQDVLQRIQTRALELQEQMQQKNSGTGIQVRVLSMAPGLETAPDAGIVAALVAAGAESNGAKKAYATEAGYFASMGIDTVVCGPGDIAQAHTADEFVALEQLQKCEQVITALVGSLAMELQR